MADPAMVTVPVFPRVSEFAGVWAMEQSAFVAHWEAIQRMDLVVHMRETESPRLESLIERVPVRGGKVVAKIDLAGVLMKQRSSMGGTSTIQARRDIRTAAIDPDVSAILLAIESPGGSVAGIDDLARDVRWAQERKPVWAHIDDLGASAAYWVASQAGAIYANSPTALVGSIGTLLTVYDISEAATREGIKALVFATGPIKGAGVPGTQVTDTQKSYFQGLVDASQEHFDQAVRRGRKLTAEQLAGIRTGAVFPASTAMERKLIDGIRPLDRTIEALAALAGSR